MHEWMSLGMSLFSSVIIVCDWELFTVCDTMTSAQAETLFISNAFIYLLLFSFLIVVFVVALARYVTTIIDYHTNKLLLPIALVPMSTVRWAHFLRQLQLFVNIRRLFGAFFGCVCVEIIIASHKISMSFGKISTKPIWTTTYMYNNCSHDLKLAKRKIKSWLFLYPLYSQRICTLFEWIWCEKLLINKKFTQLFSMRKFWCEHNFISMPLESQIHF